MAACSTTTSVDTVATPFGTAATNNPSPSQDFYDAEGFAITQTGFKFAVFNTDSNGLRFVLIRVADTFVAPTEVSLSLY